MFFTCHSLAGVHSRRTGILRRGDRFVFLDTDCTDDILTPELLSVIAIHVGCLENSPRGRCQTLTTFSALESLADEYKRTGSELRRAEPKKHRGPYRQQDSLLSVLCVCVCVCVCV